MRIGLLFVSVFFMLSAGNAVSYTGIQPSDNKCTSSEYFKKAEPNKFSNVVPKIALIKNSSSPQDNDVFIFEATGDEDQNEVSSKKYRSVDIYNSISFYYFFLNSRHNSFETVPGIWRLSPPRYILQGNLRI